MTERESSISTSQGRWERVRLKWLFQPSADANRPDEQVLSVYRDHGVIPKSSRSDNFNVTPENLDRYLLVRPGDLVVNRMKAWQGSLGISQHRGIVSGDYEVLRPRDCDLEPRFAHHLLRSKKLVSEYRIRSTGIRPSQWRLYWEQMGNITVSIPRRREQRRVADFLDHETAQIDALISKQGQLIAGLRERRDAKWASLYSDASSSGVMIPIRRVVSSVVDGPFGSSLTSAHYTTSGTRVIRLGNVGTNEFKATDEVYISDEHASALSEHCVIPGDVVIAGLGDENQPLGRAAVVPNIGPAIVKADCFRVRPTKAISSEFLAWALSAPPSRVQIRMLARGSTRQRINTAVAKSIEIPLPSRDQQNVIVAASREQTAKIDVMIAKAEEFIGLARERRAALITEAVTGRIDVSTGQGA